MPAPGTYRTLYYVYLSSQGRDIMVLVPSCLRQTQGSGFKTPSERDNVLSGHVIQGNNWVNWPTSL